MRSTLLLTVLSAALVVGCSRNIDVGDDTGTDDTGTDDTGEDSDTSTDSDSDTETGGGDSGGLDCQATYSTPDPFGGTGDDACLTQTLSCGDDFFQSTEGGTTIADSVYDQPSDGGFWACSPGVVGVNADWSAAERFYELDIPPDTSVTLRLDAKCGDLFIRAIRSETPCDVTHEHNCWLPSISGSKQTLQLTNPATVSHRYDVVVDGVDGFEGNFRLEVDCF